MTDTQPEIRRLQGQIIRQKPLEERLRMVFEMIEGGQRMVDNQFRKRHPDWSEAERKAAVFERIYRDDFTPDEMERIKAAIVVFHQQRIQK